MFKEVKQLFNFLNKELKKKVFLFFIFLAIASTLELLSIGIIFPSLHYIINSENNTFDFIISYFSNNPITDVKTKLFIFLIIYFVIISAKNLFMMFYIWWRNKLVYFIQTNISTNLYRNYLYLDLQKFKSLNTSELTKNIMVETQQARICIDICLRSLVEILSILVIAITLIFYQPHATFIVTIITLLIFFIIFFFFRNTMNTLGKRQVTVTGQVFRSLQSGLSSFKSILIEGNQNYFVKSFGIFKKKRTDTMSSIATINENIRYLIEFFAISLLVFIIFILTELDSNIKNLIPSLTLFGAAFYRLMPAINRLLNNLNSFEASKASIRLLEKHFHIKKKAKKNELIKSIEFKKNIIFKNIFYSYSKDNHVIKNLNFKINKNDFIVLSGSSGIGKTTFVDILCGLIEPNKGNVFIDNKHNIQKNVDSWKKNIGYVLQSSYILDSTIKDNIVFDKQKVDQKKLKNAINFSNLKDFINQKKEGVNFKVGEDGCNLSGGQAQRLKIARAIYQNPEILICDEITNSLDKKNEDKIIKALLGLRKKMTIICITHNTNAFKSRFIKKYEFLNKDKTKLKKLS